MYMSPHLTVATNLEERGLSFMIFEETVAGRCDTPFSRPHSSFVVGPGIKADVFVPLTTSGF